MSSVCASTEMRDGSSKWLISARRLLYQPTYTFQDAIPTLDALAYFSIYQKNKCPSYWLILYPAWKANWHPEGPIWTLQGLCWPSLGLWVNLDPEDPVGPWVDLDASSRIGVATTVGTYKAAEPEPSDLELISSAASKEKPPGLICLWKFLEENAAIWRFTMNGLHLNLEGAQNTMLLWKGTRRRKQRIGCLTVNLFIGEWLVVNPPPPLLPLFTVSSSNLRPALEAIKAQYHSSLLDSFIDCLVII